MHVYLSAGSMASTSAADYVHSNDEFEDEYNKAKILLGVIHSLVHGLTFASGEMLSASEPARDLRRPRKDHENADGTLKQFPLSTNANFIAEDLGAARTDVQEREEGEVEVRGLTHGSVITVCMCLTTGLFSSSTLPRHVSGCVRNNWGSEYVKSKDSCMVNTSRVRKEPDRRPRHHVTMKLTVHHDLLRLAEPAPLVPVLAL